MTRAGKTPMRTLGTMLRFVRDRGFAFAGDGQGHEWFVHRSGCEPPALYDTLTEGNAVSFQSMTTTKGQRAFDLRLATDDERAQTAVTQPATR